MSLFLDLLNRDGLRLLLGLSIILTPASLIALSLRRPDRVRRLGTLSVLGALTWLSLELVMGLCAWNPPWSSPVAFSQSRMSVPISPSVIDSKAREPRSVVSLERRPLESPRSENPESSLPVSPIPEVSFAESSTIDLQVVPSTESTNPRDWNSRDWGQLALISYFSLMGLCFLYLIAGIIHLVLSLRRTREAEPSIKSLVPDRVRIRVLEGSNRVFCCGLLRPTIIVPPSILKDRHALKCVIAHEMGHITNRDLRDRLLFALAIPFLYPLPLFWWLKNRVHLSGELLADDHAAHRASLNDYVESMISLVELKMRPGPFAWLSAPLTVPLLSRSSLFYRRMTMLLNRHGKLASDSRLQKHVWNTVPLIALGLVLWIGAPAKSEAQETQDEKSKREASDPIDRADESTSNAHLQKVIELGSLKPDPKKTPVLVLNTDLQMFPLPGASNSGSFKGTIVGGSFAFESVEIPNGVTLVVEGSRQLKITAKGTITIQGDVKLTNQSKGYTIGTLPIVQEESTPPVENPPLNFVPLLDLDQNSENSNNPDDGANHSLYILELTERSINLDGEKSALELKLARLAPLVQNGSASQTELETVRIQLETIHKKLALVRMAIKSEIDRLHIQLESLTQDMRTQKKKSPEFSRSRQTIVRVEGKLQMLESVL